MATINFGGVKEEVVTRDEFPLSKAQEVLKNEVVAIIGYGPQGYGQSLNMRDNGINVIIGQRKGGKGWKDAVTDGWVEGKNLFENIEEAIQKATIVQYLLSDAGQKAQWPLVQKYLKKGQALYFSHGFSIVFN
jgi:ketol-acid reductoisomerase